MSRIAGKLLDDAILVLYVVRVFGPCAAFAWIVDEVRSKVSR